MLVEYKQSPTADEARFLREAQWIVGMSKGPGWNCLKKEMERMIDVCRSLYEGSESSDLKINEGMRLRLKMTKAVVRDIVNWVESTEARYKATIDELTSDVNPETELPQTGDQYATEEIDEYSTANY